MCQETLVRAFELWVQSPPGRNPRPWLFAIATQLCRSRSRSRGRRTELARLVAAPSGGPLADVVAEADSDGHVRLALQSLAPRYREAVTLFHLEGMTYEEMAEITGCTVAALKQRVRRGSALLREAYSRACPDDPARSAHVHLDVVLGGPGRARVEPEGLAEPQGVGLGRE